MPQRKTARTSQDLSPGQRRGEDACLVGEHLLLFSIFVTAAVSGIAILYPSIRWASALGPATTVGLIVSQTFLLTFPGLLVGGGLSLRWPRPAMIVGSVLIFSALPIVLCDVITFHWIGERFLSRAVWRAMTSYRDPLAGHVSQSMMVAATAIVLGCAAYGFLSWLSARALSRRWSQSERCPSLGKASLILVGFVVITALPALRQGSLATEAMQQYSARFPLCAFHIVSYHGVGKPAELRTTSVPQSANHTLQSEVAAREHHQRQLFVNMDPVRSTPMPDVLIVVIESFRHELVTADIMPSLWDYAQRGVHCRQHFSGGNATNHGMFSLVNGLEAAWYEKSVRFSPLLNRLFRQAGYRLGFFGGHDDWRKFLMDGYINDQQYDVFETSSPNWLESDRRATELAAQFLDRTGRDNPDLDTRAPHLAVLYLYSTHANYHSYASDQVFQPAADDRFLIPYRKSVQPEVWNRYKNSARSMDRFLRAVLKPNRVIVVTGDHGESFLEDGVCGHGVRITRYQNMTPAVIYVPEGTPRVIDHPTMHADLLPTILAAADITVSRGATLDGCDLLNTSDHDLSSRIFATRNYLSDDQALIGPWTLDPQRPFGFRIALSLKNIQAEALSAIDDTGSEQSGSTEEAGRNGPSDACQEALNRWLEQRFGL